MPKWEISISINNGTDRTLKLESMMVPWGDESSRAETIAPGQVGTFGCYARSGAAYGPEYYFTLVDVPPEGEAAYGRLDVHVDIPYFKNQNTLDIHTGGTLKALGYAPLTNGQHNYSTQITILHEETRQR